MNNIIEVTQKPIIAYSLIEQKSQEVEAKIQSLNINTLEASEDNLSIIKSTRAELNNEFKTLEEQRKLVKDIVLKDYNDFEDKYKKLIASKYKEADSTLKGLVDTVTDQILQTKIDGLKNYFAQINTHDFVSFEDIGLKIIKSTSDKKYKDEIEAYLLEVETNLRTIDTLQHKERILAKFQTSKNLSDAIAQTNMEVQREEQIKAQSEERERAMQEQQRLRDEQAQQANMPKQEVNYDTKQFDKHIDESLQEVDNSICEAKFKVFGTIEQLKELKQFMQQKGIRYE
jgi:hypothetical protein